MCYNVKNEYTVYLQYLRKWIMKRKTCCFFGHRTINEAEELKLKLIEIIKRLILDEKVDTFLFGSKSRFDSLCLRLVTEIKRSASPDKTSLRTGRISLYKRTLQKLLT